MTKKNRIYSTLTTLLAASLLSGAALAEQAHQVSMAQAREIALQKVPGQVLEEESGKEGGRLIYSFEIRPKGAKSGATEIKIDAKSGAIVSVANDAEDEGSRERDEPAPRR